MQSAVDIAGRSVSQCSTTKTSGAQCFEGNLDIEYIMGVAQVSQFCCKLTFALVERFDDQTCYYAALIEIGGIVGILVCWW